MAGRDRVDGESRSRWSFGPTRRGVLRGVCAAGLATGLPGLLSGSATATVPPRVVGYYGGWTRYTQEYFPEDLPLESLTDLNYAFLTVESDGTVTYADEWGDQENLAVLRERKSSSEVDCYLSIGGWNDSTYFSDAAASQETRERFAETAITLMREYDFDGIDVDWEYPGGGGHADNVTREEDPENFALLLEEVRAQLDDAEVEDGATYGLTIAAAAIPDTAGNLPLEAIEPHLEYVSVMTYDFAGGWSAETGHNAPLYGDGFSVGGAMDWWADGALPREKVVLGLPFFGQRFEGVPPDDDGLGQPFASASSILYGEVEATYGDDSSVERHWDEEAMVPWLYDADEEVFVSYDDPESIGLKVEYALERDFGGVMYWEAAGDPADVLLEAVLDTIDDETEPEEGPPPVGDEASAPTDPDGDGRYEDVNGNGNADFDDIVTFFDHMDDAAVQDNVSAFDFNGNGGIDFADVVSLFEQI